ncbi:hypothetical protein STEG23_009055, partial [Scotinomys teguina]
WISELGTLTRLCSAAQAEEESLSGKVECKVTWLEGRVAEMEEGFIQIDSQTCLHGTSSDRNILYLLHLKRIFSKIILQTSVTFQPMMDALRLANSAFAVDLFKQLCEKEPVGNILFSPICLSTSLSLAQVGAKGDTANEIGQVLHFENVKDVPFGFQTVTSDVNKLSSFYSLKLIKRLYVDKSLNPSTEFISSTKRPYAKELETVDFKDKLEETKGQINSSVKELTDGHFEDILSENSVSDQTKILVVNAAYFVGKWMKKFPESETKECPFRVNKTDTKPVQMMNLEATFCLGNIDDINAKIIELPFQNKHLSMLIVLPKDVEDESTGLEKVRRHLDT